MSRATLGSKLNAGVTMIVCPRCGFWEVFVPQLPHVTRTESTTTLDYSGTFPDYENRPCPDCQQPLDAVVPPPRPKCQTN